ncbi:MAG: glycosyltransferase, partial [Candidatus Aminicenantes bacterium]
MLIDKKKAEPLKSLTVLHIAPTPFFSDRGCHIRIKGIINALKKKGVRSILCAYHLGRDIPHIETVRTPRLPGFTKKEPGPSPFKYPADILLFFKVFSVIHKKRPHIIHAHLHEGALIGWAARAFFFWRKIPLVFDMQGSLTGELESHGYFDGFKPLKKVFRTIEYLIARMPDYFVCSSQRGVDILRSNFRVNPNRIFLAYDGYDIERADPAALNEMKNKMNLPSGTPIVIYTGLLMKA